ncbi:MAG: hypothetical protein ACOYMK_02630 [Hyphomonadaceae bacterium]
MKVLSDEASTYVNFMHMHVASRPHAKAQLSASPGGIAVNRGAMLGNIGNIQQGAADGTITVPTTRHLHVEISIPIVNPSTGNLESARLPPYASLVEAYQRRQAGTPWPLRRDLLSDLIARLRENACVPLPRREEIILAAGTLGEAHLQLEACAHRIVLQQRLVALQQQRGWKLLALGRPQRHLPLQRALFGEEALGFDRLVVVGQFHVDLL